MRIALVTLFTVLASIVAHAQNRAAEPKDEMLHIDGSKNPELIPQWSAWEFAFRVIAGGRKELPTTVHRVVTREEADLIKKEAEGAQKIEPACEERMSRLRPLMLKENAEVLNAKAHAVTLGCRRQTLDARDRVLNGLSQEARAALAAFVESTKAGTTFSIQKSKLARFLEPE